MKHRHILTVNKVNEESCKYIYNYGKTKNIQLLISKDGVSISADLQKEYDKEKMLSAKGYVFSDGLKKALLIYLIKYSKNLKIDRINIEIDGKIDIIDYSKEIKLPIYSMITNELSKPIPCEFMNESLIQYILNTTKTKCDERMASLFAYICSKNKEFENERFIYLWTAFNGMYNWISKSAKNQIPKRRITDTEGIKTIQRYLNLGNETICEKDKTNIANKVINILSRYKNDINGKSCINNSNLDSEISRVLYKTKGGKYNLSSYGYLLTQFSYYYRCKIIHGNKPILLFVHSDETDLISLQIINILLEEVITENLPFWFDDKYISETVIPKLDKF